MKLPQHVSPVAIALALVAAPAFASGNVHVVGPVAGPGVDFTNLQSAVDAAAADDLILVESGSYAGFTVQSKPLTITADLGASIDISGTVRVELLDAGEVVVLSGLDVDANGAGTALWLESNVGPVHVERCTFIGTGLPIFIPGHAVQLASCDSTTFTDCTIQATTAGSSDAGVLSQSSDIRLYESVCVGASGLSSANGGAGCRVIGGTLFASGTTFTGGTGGAGGVSGPFMICSDGGPGGTGLSLENNLFTGDPDGTILDCSFNGGAGGAPGGPECSTGPAGTGLDVQAGPLTTIQVPARTYEVTSPIRSGEPATLSFHGAENEFVFLLVSSTQTPFYTGLFKGVWHPATPYFLVFVGNIPASGDLDVVTTVNLDPSLQCAVLHEQPLYYQLSTEWTLGAPRPSVILANSF
ncbi:MAG: hypothetical protein AAF682_09045 [Planctomycetota bacterium]